MHSRGQHRQSHQSQRGGGERRSDGAPFEPYITPQQARDGVNLGLYRRGVLRAADDKQAYVPVKAEGFNDILIDGKRDRNRAFHGDTVVVALYPRSEWKKKENAYSKNMEQLWKQIKEDEAVDEAEKEDSWNKAQASFKNTATNVEYHPTGRVVFVEQPKGSSRVHLATLCANRNLDNDAADVSKDSRVIVKNNKEAFVRAMPVDKKIPWILIPLENVLHFIPDLFDPDTRRETIEEIEGPSVVPSGVVPDDGGLLLGKVVGPADPSIPWGVINNMTIFPVRISSWGEKSQLPAGVLDGPSVGDAGQPDVEAHIALCNNELEMHEAELPPECQEEAERIVKKARETHEEECRKRVDLRNVRIMTIDPATARDLDDAIHVIVIEPQTPGGEVEFEIGVHIADVSHFVEKGGPIDTNAKERCTTVYMTHKAFHMLPRQLCADLCSLNPNEDKLAYSAVFRLKADGELSDSFRPRFFRSVIRTCCRWNYDEVQKVLDNEDFPEELRPQVTGGHIWEDACADLFNLECLTQRIRQKRFDHGSLALHKTKLRFQCESETNMPRGVGYESHSSSHELIEELMLLANQLVARKCRDSAVSRCAVLRRHPSPDEKQLDELDQFLNDLKIEHDFSTAKTVYASLRGIWEKYGYLTAQCVERLLMKPMRPAEYFTPAEPDKTKLHTHEHYALSFDIYTHFTSPIRRYADVMVHRTLTAVLELEAKGVFKEVQASDEDGEEAEDDFGVVNMDGNVSPAEYGLDLVEQELILECQLCNEKKLASKRAQEDCDRSFFCMYLRELPADNPCTAVAAVLVIQDKSCLVHVPQLGLEARITYELDPRKIRAGTYQEKPGEGGGAKSKAVDSRHSANKIYPKFKGIPKWPLSIKHVDRAAVEAEWEIPEEYRRGKAKTMTQKVKLFSPVPVYVLPTQEVPIKYVLTMVPPYTQLYKDLLRGDGTEGKKAVELAKIAAGKADLPQFMQEMLPTVPELTPNEPAGQPAARIDLDVAKRFIDHYTSNPPAASGAWGATQEGQGAPPVWGAAGAPGPSSSASASSAGAPNGNVGMGGGIVGENGAGGGASGSGQAGGGGGGSDAQVNAILNRILVAATDSASGMLQAELVLELTACPFTTPDGAQKVAVYLPETDEVEEADVSSLNTNIFFGGLNQYGNATESEMLLSTLTAAGYNPQGLDMAMHSPGDSFSFAPLLPLTKARGPGDPKAYGEYTGGLKGPQHQVAVAVSLKNPNYFDLGVAFRHNDPEEGGEKWGRFAYARNVNSKLKGIYHSGDIHTHHGPREVLIHTVNFDELCNLPPNTHFCVYATGYEGNIIRQYKAIILMLREGDRMDVIPAPLDHATVGDARGMVLLVGKRMGDGSKLLMKVLDVPVTGDFEVMGDDEQLAQWLDAAVQSVPQNEVRDVAMGGGVEGQGERQSGEGTGENPPPAALPKGSLLVISDSDVSEGLATEVMSLVEPSFASDALRVALSGSTLAVLKKKSEETEMGDTEVAAAEGGGDEQMAVENKQEPEVQAESWVQKCGLVPDPAVHEGGKALTPEDVGGVSFPWIPGTYLEGSLALCLAKSLPARKGETASLSEYMSSLVNTQRPALLLATPSLKESVASSQKHKLHGVAIIDTLSSPHAPAPPNPNPYEDPPGTLEERLSKLNQASAVARMGPLSCTLAHEDGRFFFLSGVQFEGLFGEKRPAFGEDVTEDVKTRLGSFLSGSTESKSDEALTQALQMSPEAPLFTPDPSRVAFSLGKWMSSEEVIRAFVEVPLAELIKSSDFFLDGVIPQVRRSLRETDMDTFVKSLQAALVQKVGPTMKAMKEKMLERVRSGESMKKDGDTTAQIQKMRSLQKRVNEIGRKLSNLTSEVGAFTQTFAVKKLQRKQKIENNVQMAKAMDVGEIAEFLDENTEMCLILMMQSLPLKAAYTLMKQKRFNWGMLGSLGLSDELVQVEGLLEKHANTPGLGRPLVDIPVEGDWCLSSFDFGCLMGLEEEGGVHPLARARGQSEKTLAIPFWRGQGLSALPIPILKEDYDRRFTGAEEANEEVVAKLRILLRQSLVDTLASRERYGETIAPSDHQVGWLLVYLLCKSLRVLIGRLSAVPATDDKTATTVRGLLWLLGTTLCSGAEPMSVAYNVFQRSSCRPKVPLRDFEWAIYATVAKSIPYMNPHRKDFRFSGRAMRRQLSRVLVRLVMKTAVCPFLEPMQKVAAGRKKEDRTRESHEQRTKYMNEVWYPKLKELKSLCKEAEALDKARKGIEEAGGETETMAASLAALQSLEQSQQERAAVLREFFSKPENINRRVLRGCTATMLAKLNGNSATYVMNKHAPKEAGVLLRYPGQTDWQVPSVGERPPPGAEDGVAVKKAKKTQEAEDEEGTAGTGGEGQVYRQLRQGEATDKGALNGGVGVVPAAAKAKAKAAARRGRGAERAAGMRRRGEEEGRRSKKRKGAPGSKLRKRPLQWPRSESTAEELTVLRSKVEALVFSSASASLEALTSLEGVPQREWLLEIAEGAGWGSSEVEVMRTVRLLLFMLDEGENWRLQNNELEEKAVNFIGKAVRSAGRAVAASSSSARPSHAVAAAAAAAETTDESMTGGENDKPETETEGGGGGGAPSFLQGALDALAELARHPQVVEGQGANVRGGAKAKAKVAAVQARARAKAKAKAAVQPKARAGRMSWYFQQGMASGGRGYGMSVRGARQWGGSEIRGGMGSGAQSAGGSSLAPPSILVVPPVNGNGNAVKTDGRSEAEKAARRKAIKVVELERKLKHGKKGKGGARGDGKKQKGGKFGT
uniref:RNB domain-containing protein n=1 Tax=Chromera velia CCMP2878 TaxID=1169474 RepID=A0A0G4HCJ6_9ALVE|eukprot:Cvel_6295.t1-p1 / transcript=Cvel_6295.t1 / gene=Cvel_6295 / organism=Chromera_velia_CCMP2878 / gene_product=DIS3-like exonuclease 2, putative / transcript_product=DIS3-like exonuclease 2, putative / location=Cvel_scaffold305:65078-88046(+) / protein_length=2776 / sequence_SO=supercontig / SO=protein_coding / is_pseudo=false